MSIKDVRQNAYSATSHSLRQFVNKINVSKDYDNKQPDPTFTFIHERDFMVQFLLANGQSFEGITALLTNGSDSTGNNIKEQPKYLPGDYMTEFLTESNGSEYWDFYLKSINIPNIIQGSSRTESLDDGSNWTCINESPLVLENVSTIKFNSEDTAGLFKVGTTDGGGELEDGLAYGETENFTITEDTVLYLTRASYGDEM